MNRRGRNRDNRWLLWVLGTLFCIYLLGTLRVDAETLKVRGTCYIDYGQTASGYYTRPGVAAAKPEWVGKTLCINKVNEDGSIGEFLGYYEVLDTGYGRETGVGESRIFKGRTLGTIETGETVDIWMPTLHQVEEWVDDCGDYIYITVIDAEG